MDFRNRVVGWLVLISLLWAAGWAPAAFGADAVQVLIKKNEEARAKIRSARYKVEWRYDYPGKRGSRGFDLGVAHFLRKGDWLLARDAYMIANLEEEVFSSSANRIVVNDHYFARWEKSSADVFIYPYDSLSVMPPEAKKSLGYNIPQDVIRDATALMGNRCGKRSRKSPTVSRGGPKGRTPANPATA